MGFLDFFKARAGAKGFRQALKQQPDAIVFYAEDAASFVHLRGAVEALLDQSVPVVYTTSAIDDPLLERSGGGFSAHYIGEGVVRTSFFVGLEARVMVMTMPDLATMFIKRSSVANVHYVYIFHSIVSTHLIYREDAFDHYDTVLTVGPHHEQEIRQREAVAQLPAKHLVPGGYGRLDDMRAELRAMGEQPLADGPILVAPSWGPTCILETIGEPLCKALLDAGLEVVVRPHPMTVRRTPEVLDNLRTTFANAALTIETDIRGFDSMRTCSMMISDWSGVAFEYAFAFERPVLFIDTPKKTRNERWQSIDATPVEIDYRDQLGAVVGVDALATIPAVISSLTENAEATRQRIVSARDALIHNLDGSDLAQARALREILRAVTST